MKQLRSIQVLRGVAACSIVALHAGAQIATPGAGVDLFFVISGFIMASIPKRSSFLFDRFWRIYPLWWIAVLPWILFTAPSWQQVVTSLTLWPIIGTWQRTALSVGWTLSFEMLFYFAVAASMRFGAKPLLALFALMLAGAAFLRWPIFNYFGNPMIFEFLFGALIGRLPKIPRLAVPLLIFAVICLFAAPTWIAHVEFALRIASAWRVLYWGVPAALIVYACLSLERVFEHRFWNFAVLLGDASYSIYLFHVGVMLVFTGIVGFVGGVSLGIAAWWLIERNVIKTKPGNMILGRSRVRVL